MGNEQGDTQVLGMAISDQPGHIWIFLMSVDIARCQEADGLWYGQAQVSQVRDFTVVLLLPVSCSAPVMCPGFRSTDPDCHSAQLPIIVLWLWSSHPTNLSFSFLTANLMFKDVNCDIENVVISLEGDWMLRRTINEPPDCDWFKLGFTGWNRKPKPTPVKIQL